MSLKQRVANAPLKIISLMLAYSFWTLLNQMHPTLLTVTVPLCFYGEQKATTKISAPETLKLTLSGKRTDLANLDLTTLAAHVDATTLVAGPNNLTLTREHLFVPPSCNLVHYKPSNIVISVHEETITT
jgi:hypothetical protein